MPIAGRDFYAAKTSKRLKVEFFTGDSLAFKSCLGLEQPLFKICIIEVLLPNSEKSRLRRPMSDRQQDAHSGQSLKVGCARVAFR